MEKLENSMKNNDNPITLIGLNFKLIVRKLIFLFGLIIAGLQFSQFLSSLINAINTDFYLQNKTSLNNLAFFAFFIILIQLLVDLISFGKVTFQKKIIHNFTREIFKISTFLTSTRIKIASFLLGFIFIPLEWRFMFKPTDINTSPLAESLYQQYSNLSNNVFIFFILLYITFMIYLSRKQVIYENDVFILNKENQIENKLLFYLKLENLLKKENWEEELNKLIVEPAYRNLIRIYKVKIETIMPSKENKFSTTYYNIYSETTSGVPLDVTQVKINFYEPISNFYESLNNITKNENQNQNKDKELAKENSNSESKINSDKSALSLINKELKSRPLKETESNLDPNAISEEIKKRIETNGNNLKKLKTLPQNNKKRPGLGKVNPRFK